MFGLKLMVLASERPTSALQILSFLHTKVVAGARPGENADDLRALSGKYVGRVKIIEIELLDKDSVKVGKYKEYCRSA